MADIVVNLALSVICFAGQCHPALTGDTTPTGTFSMKRYSHPSPQFGGDLLVFKESQTEVWAIHRVIDAPGQNRKQRLLGPASGRRSITNGCINIDPKVYDLLVSCCSKQRLVIK